MSGQVVNAGRVRNFDPLTVPNLVAWFDADDASSFTFSSGSVVSQWNDKSTAARHLSQGTVADQPTRSASGGPNSRGTVTFATGDFLTALAWSSALTQPVSVFIVCTTGAANTLNIFDGATASRMVFGINGSGRLYQNAGSSRAVTEVFGQDTEFAIYELIFNAAGSKVYKNGLDCNQTASTIGTGTWARLQLAKEQSSTLYWAGSISEMLVIDGSPTAAEREYVMRGLSKKYDIQIARRELTTFVASADNCVRIEPANYNGHAVIYFHGSGETQLSLAPDSLKRQIMVQLADMGFVVVAANGGGNNWGNQAAIDDYAAALAAADTAVGGIDKVFHLAQSMGGLASLTGIAQGAIQCDGWYGIYPVCDLRNMYDSGGSFEPAIETAYGIAADGSDYAAKTSGFDPVLRSAADFTGKRFRFIASTGDTVVPKADHTDVMHALVSSVAAESTVTTHTGDHGDASAFLPGDVTATFYRWMS